MIDDNPKMDTKQWIMEGLARAFGICVTLRDDSDLAEEQIKERLQNDYSVTWHEEELNKANKLVTELAKRTDEQWKKIWEESEAEKVKHNEKSIAEKKVMAERHLKVRQDLETVMTYVNADEITRNIAKFGIEQLDLVKSETEPYILGSTPFKQFKLDCIQSAKRDVDYHTEELKEHKERVTERLTAYKRLRKDIDEALALESRWNASFVPKITTEAKP
jgi:hypothetical protein